MKITTGMKIFSSYFNEWIVVDTIIDDNTWYFIRENGERLKARTPLSYFGKVPSPQLAKTIKKFVDTNERLAKKYGMKISISAGGTEVVLADHTGGKK